MKHLIQTSANQFMTLNGEPILELIFVTMEPEYQMTKKGTVTKSNAVETFRCMVGRASLNVLMLALMDYDKAMEGEAK